MRALEGIFDPIFAITPQYDKRISPQQSSLGGPVNPVQPARRLFIEPFSAEAVWQGRWKLLSQFSNSHTNTSNSFSLLNPFYSSNLSLQFTQPLLRDRSIDNNRRQIRIQRKRLDQSDADFRQRTIEVITRVQQAYWELVFALRDQQNQLANLNLSRESLRNVEAQIAAGAKAPLERAEVQTELANRETALLLAIQAVAIAENNLKVLIFKESNNPEWSAQLTPTDTPKFDTTPVNLDDALKAARDNRPELRRSAFAERYQRYRYHVSSRTRPSHKSIWSALWRLLVLLEQASPAPCAAGDSGASDRRRSADESSSVLARADSSYSDRSGSSGGGITAGYRQKQERINPTLIGGYGQTLRNLFGGDTRNITVGVAISLPFKNKTAEANLAGARIQKEQLQASTRSQEQTIEVDVRNSAQAVESSRQRVLSAREARTNAEMQLEGEQRLYQVGRSTTFLLFQRENALANARASELRAETDYNKALADLQRATSTTLRANNVVVDTLAP